MNSDNSLFITNILKMLLILLFICVIVGINCEPETVRGNFDYFNYGANDDVLKNLDLHLVCISYVLVTPIV